MNPLFAEAIRFLDNIIIGPDTFNRILGAVQRWASKEIASAEKRQGVLAELEIIGLELSESIARLGVELAVQYFKTAGRT